jgi:cytochrome c-type biogenesis protein CcmH/NrfF
MPDVPRLVSARGFLVIALPVMLLGLGGVAFYMGSRRRSDRPVRDEDEERDLEAFVRSRHGRKRPPVR